MAADAVRRRSRRLTWGRSRRFVQALSLLAFFLLFLGASRLAIAPSLVALPFRLDPLTMLAQTLASRRLLATSALALLTLAFTLVLGRAWCGWLCPLGTLLDVFTPRRPKPSSERLEPWRAWKYLLLLAVLVSALFGSLTLLILDPLTLVFRALASSLWPALDQVVTALERAAYRFEALRPAVNWLEGVLRPNILPLSPVHAGAGIAIFLVLAAILALNWLAPRFWCRSLCPLGGLLALVSKAAIVRRHVDPACTGCAVCARKCPTGTIRADRGFASDPAECTVCMDCVDACAKGTNAFRAGSPKPAWEDYDPSRRQALTTIGASILGVGLLFIDPRRDHPPSYRLRPPGVVEADFLKACIRCGACVRACPTAALNPAVMDAGWEGVWSPVLIPRLGYCDYSCNACGQVCPVQAIPPLPLEAKRQQIIGVAYIDQNRCIAWADRTDCIVCEEMCPVPEKAITLEPATVPGANGAEFQVKLPRVDRARCIGCGICEYKCPVAGEAAIRVYTTATTWL